MEMFLIVIIIILFAATYFFFAKAEIPLQEIVIDGSTLQSSLQVTQGAKGGISSSLRLEVSFAIYVIAVFSWFGW